MQRAHVIVTALLFAMVSTVSGAPPDEAPPKVFGSDSPLVIPAAAFSTNGNDADSHLFNPFLGSLQGTAAGGGCVQAPAYLPQGAKVTSVYASVIDDDGDHNVYISLHATPNRQLTGGSVMATLQSSGQSTTVQAISDVVITSPDVRLPNFSYWVSTCMPSPDTKLLSVRIYYQEPMFLDGFECGETWVWSAVGS